MWGPRPNLLRLIVSRVANSTLVYDMPLNAGTPKAIRTCPTPSKPVAQVQEPPVPGVGPDTPAGWGAQGTQAASQSGLIAGIPGAPAPNAPGRPDVPIAGVVAVATF